MDVRWSSERRPHSRLGAPALAWGLAVALVTSSCSSYVSSRAEAAILETLPRSLGPAELYRATVTGASADGTSFDRVLVSGDRVQRPSAPVIERLEVDLSQVQIDRVAKKITAIGSASAVVRVAEGDLARYLAQRGWIVNPEVRLLPPDGLSVRGALAIPQLAAASFPPASLQGRLVPKGTQLHVTVDSLRLGEREAPALLRGVVAAAVNPLFDLADHAVPSRFDRVSVQADAIQIEASGSQMRVVQRP